jgi:hypothetical protein
LCEIFVINCTVPADLFALIKINGQKDCSVFDNISRFKTTGICTYQQQPNYLSFPEVRTVNTCGDATAARWNLIRSLSDYHHNTTSSRGEDHVTPHVLVASSLQAEMEAVITALQLPHTSLQALQPASHLTAAARLVSHLGRTQVQIVSAQLQK